MGLIRDWIESDTKAVTEWIARKCHNHNPLRVRAQSRGPVSATMISLEIENNAVVCVAGDGQAYRITVEGLGHFASLPEEVREGIKNRPYSYTDWKQGKQKVRELVA